MTPIGFHFCVTKANSRMPSKRQISTESGNREKGSEIMTALQEGERITGYMRTVQMWSGYCQSERDETTWSALKKNSC